MSEDRFQRIKDIVSEAMELPAEERNDYLDRECGDDTALRVEVLSLLDHEDADPRWPEQPLVPPLMDAPGAGSVATMADWTPAAGDRFGRYRVEEALGRGGMGAVALAVREDDFEKRVALKVLTVISPGLIRRFEQERQMLARLEHQNVARLLDGGAVEGRPWFAMEYVDGVPIDRYCDERDLGLHERIELVLQVCSGLEVAHRNLVIHRDIKPSNILVPASGLPKILDFGIAKSLAPSAVTELTHISERPMTPRWASPEQINAEAVTTATDVYGIGLLLYRLLTGSHAFGDERSEMELIAAIKEREPDRPSSRVSGRDRRAALAGDLDAILDKALRKDPTERYGSIGELAADLRRHLDGLPVEAREGSRWYRVSRFLKRNRVAVTVASVFVATVLAFSVYSLQLAEAREFERDRANDARDRAQDARDRAQEASDRSDQALSFVSGILWDLSEPDNKEDKIAIVRRAEEESDDQDDPLLQAKILEVVGQTYAEWGELDAAVVAWERALELQREVHLPTNPDGHPDIAIAMNNLAGGHFRVRDYDQAAKLLHETLEMKERLAGDVEGLDIAKSMANLGSALMRSGELEGVEELYQKSLELRENAPEPDPEEIGKSYRGLAAYYLEADDASASEKASQQAIEQLLIASEGEETTRIASARTGLARAIQDQGRADEALAIYRQALATRLDAFGDDHLHIASSHLDLTRALIDLGLFDEAREHLDQAAAWLAAQPAHRHSAFRARANALSGALGLRRGQCNTATLASLQVGFDGLSEGRHRLDHYGRRAAGWLHEFKTTCGVQVDQPVAVESTIATDG